MPKTVVGLFENAGLIDDVVSEIEALGFPRKEVRTQEEPKTFEVTGVMSFPRLDFEAGLTRALTRIGTTKAQAQAYIDGLRRGGALAFATGTDDKKLAAAADIMKRHGAVDTDLTIGAEPELAGVARANMTPIGDGRVQAGRISESGASGGFFVW
jgi:hypothetical protein